MTICFCKISPSGASNFLAGQKVTKEPSKGREVSIPLSPLKSPLTQTTNQGGLRSPLLDVPPGRGCSIKMKRFNESGVLKIKVPLVFASVFQLFVCYLVKETQATKKAAKGRRCISGNKFSTWGYAAKKWPFNQLMYKGEVCYPPGVHPIGGPKPPWLVVLRG